MIGSELSQFDVKTLEKAYNKQWVLIHKNDLYLFGGILRLVVDCKPFETSGKIPNFIYIGLI